MNLEPGSHVTRRRALTILGGAGLAAFATACRPLPGGSAAGAASAMIPQETAGPYPADGTNGANALTMAGIVRSDIRPSFGSYAGTAAGVPLKINLLVQENSNGKPLPGYAVYLWHADRDGKYSLYSQGVTNQNYLRGVQAADKDGWVAFSSIFPAAYDGRWPHIHFEVYSDVAAATGGGKPVATSQLALPKATCDLVYATSGYEQSVRNLAGTTLARDMVFSDGTSQQIPNVNGSVKDGFEIALTVPV
jgi:protocatechuate 3,4-dioxygenase beta subunit